MQDFSLQGRVYLGQWLGGRPGALRWCGDAAALQVNPTVNSDSRQESYSGLRRTSATLPTSLEVAVSLTLNYASAKNLVLALGGEIQTDEGDSLTGESLPADLVAGDLVQLDKTQISNLQIEDSAATPTALTEGTHYRISSAGGGLIEILNVADLTQPLVASYDYGASERVLMYTDTAPVRYVQMIGANTVPGSQSDHIRAQLYKVQFDPAQLDLISDSLGDIELSGTALVDSAAEEDSTLGAYGRVDLWSEAS